MSALTFFPRLVFWTIAATMLFVAMLPVRLLGTR